MGKTPVEYVTNWRMTVATKLLRTTTLSVEAVALQVGYDSSTAFSSAFRRHFAISPGRYRSQRDHASRAAGEYLAEAAAFEKNS
ncbi:helix-turn-helix transcriptional regulator [Mycolicibacterium sp. BiH015]|uniref:helix-turn-helix transcriptional regulator n=1 Tax=Mycolicibacterium sp. BiH015 TaxID=3018808 RepID=UPI0022E28AD1|nr:helix-turn-helix transcriptional regulator [Mycolicibacterium sp. BiH015]MDA2890617.1 helix-turn-helix transcriptional regulator [Mycolicibacterium sp. BiH015]